MEILNLIFRYFLLKQFSAPELTKETVATWLNIAPLLHVSIPYISFLPYASIFLYVCENIKVMKKYLRFMFFPRNPP